MPLMSEIRKLAREGESLTVRNTQRTVTVFTNGSAADDVIEWQAHGSATGLDIQDVPSTFLRNSAFAKAVASGILEVIEADDPSVLAAFANQKSDWDARQEQARNAETLLVSQAPTATAFACIAPNGNEVCGDLTTMSGNSVNEQPPLCATHAGLKSQFVSEQTGRYVGGKPEVTWIYAQAQSVR